PVRPQRAPLRHRPPLPPRRLPPPAARRRERQFEAARQNFPRFPAIHLAPSLPTIWVEPSDHRSRTDQDPIECLRALAGSFPPPLSLRSRASRPCFPNRRIRSTRGSIAASAMVAIPLALVAKPSQPGRTSPTTARTPPSTSRAT